VSGRLIGWLTLFAVLAAANYGSRSAAGSPSRNARYHYGTAVGGLVQYAIILAVVVWIAGGSRELLALARPRSWPRALAAGVGAIVFIYIVGYIVDAFLNPGKEQGYTPTGWQPSHAGAYAANFVVVAGVAPIVEELMFRGLGFSLLRRYGDWFAILAIGVAFGVVHGLVQGLAVLVPFGAALAWLRRRAESVYPGMLVHGTFNAITLILSVTT